MLNYTDRRRDVPTLAHELGHGLHQTLAREQGIFHQDTPLTVAETVRSSPRRSSSAACSRTPTTPPRAWACWPKRSRARSQPSSVRSR